MLSQSLNSTRIALFTSFPLNVSVGSGVVRMIKGYAQALKEYGFQATIIHPEFKPTSYFNLAVRRLTFNKQIRLKNFDLLIGSDFDGFALNVPPKIVLNAGILADIVRFEQGQTQRILEHLAKRECQNVRSAQLVVVPSRYTAKKLQAYYSVPPERTRIIPLGIDLQTWQRQLQSDKKQTERPPTILCVAKQYPRKGIGDLIRAFALVRAKLPAARLRLVGAGPEFEANRGLAQQLSLADAIDFVGDVNDDPVLAQFYRNADVFCLPSYHETFGIVFVEAMAAGLPIVAYRAAAVPEVVSPSAGILTEPGNIDQLVQNLVTLLSNEQRRHQMGQAGKKVAQRFTWQKAALELLQVIDTFQGN